MCMAQLNQVCILPSQYSSCWHVLFPTAGYSSQPYVVHSLGFITLSYSNLGFTTLGYSNLGFINLGYSNLGFITLGYSEPG